MEENEVIVSDQNKKVDQMLLKNVSMWLDTKLQLCVLIGPQFAAGIVGMMTHQSCTKLRCCARDLVQGLYGFK